MLAFSVNLKHPTFNLSVQGQHGCSRSWSRSWMLLTQGGQKMLPTGHMFLGWRRDPWTTLPEKGQILGSLARISPLTCYLGEWKLIESRSFTLYNIQALIRAFVCSQIYWIRMFFCFRSCMFGGTRRISWCRSITFPTFGCCWKHLRALRVSFSNSWMVTVSSVFYGVT